MTGEYPRRNELFCVCFGMFMIIPGILTTLSILDFAEMWGDGPGPSPLIMLLFPTILFVVGGTFILLGIKYYRSWPERMREQREKMKDIHITQVLDPTADQDDAVISSGYKPTPTINIPRHCSNCGEKLSYEELVWVGPMTFRCPSCGQEMVAQRRGF